VTSPRIVCLYAGLEHDCPECGGFSRHGGVCSDACAEAKAIRFGEHRAVEEARRDEEEVFGRAVGLLLYFGFTEAEADQLLRGMT
jgi:hypothetical protein